VAGDRPTGTGSFGCACANRSGSPAVPVPRCEARTFQLAVPRSSSSAAIADSGLVQIGPNNFVAAGVRSDLAPETLIQNSLNDQQIQTLTVINTGVNSLGLLKALNTQTVLNDAPLGAMGSR
jgi:hypothetical protein